MKKNHMVQPYHVLKGESQEPQVWPMEPASRCWFHWPDLWLLALAFEYMIRLDHVVFLHIWLLALAIFGEVWQWE